ncbi:MAG: hypothetical protein ABF888_00670 [Acetobacter papayae]
MLPLFRGKWSILAGFGVLALCLAGASAHAEDDPGDDIDGHSRPDMHKLAGKPPLPRAHKDFSKYKFTPPGDKVVEQADANRLLFWTPDGRPDGYAQRRGSSVIYYNAQGVAVRVQRLSAAEMQDQ